MAPIGTSSTPPVFNSVQISQDNSSEDDFDSGNVLSHYMQDSEGAHDESTYDSETTLPMQALAKKDGSES